jgi:uncharacterized protein
MNASPSQGRPSGRTSIFSRFAGAYVRLAYHRPWLPLVVLGLITAVFFHYSQKLRIDTDLRVLLPDGTPSKIAMQEVETRKGSTDFYTIAFEAPDIEVVGRFQKALAESLSHWPEVEWTQFDQDRSFFERKALLYVPVDQLLDLKDRVSGMIGEKFADANPLVSDLLDDEPAGEASLKGWPEADALRRQGLPKDIVDALIDKIREETGEEADVDESIEPATEQREMGERDEHGDPVRPDSLSARLMGWHEEKGMWVGVVLAQLSKPSTDAVFAKGMMERGEALIESMRPESYGAGLVARVAGAYRNFKEINQVGSDMWLAGVISFLLMVSLLWFFVRKVVNLVIINVPLLVAMTWTAGATYLIYERLTLLTAFILALIFGLGIEYTVHLYSRWAEESRKGKDPVSSMTAAMLQTGRGLISGAATNILAMVSLQIGHFKGFQEFGVAVSLGITCALVTTWFVLPPVFFLFVRLSGWLEPRMHGSPAVGRVVAFLLPSQGEVKGGTLLPAFHFSDKVWRYIAVAALLFTAGIAFAPPAGFENDFKNLRGKSTSAGISYGRAVGGGRNTSPSIILGQSEAQMRSVHDSLVARYGDPADSMLQSYATIQSFVPSETQQAERMAILNDIKGLLDARALDRADSATREQLNVLRDYLEPAPFGFDSLPGWAQRFLTESDGSYGKLGYLYGTLRESDAVESHKFQERFQYLPSHEGKVLVASSGFIYADVVSMVKSDGVFLAIVTLLILIVVTAIDMRNWRGVVAVVGFILLSGFWTYKLMGLLGLKLGMFNLVVVPTILSVSVDSVIHLYHRRRELGAGKLGELYSTTGSAVLAGTLNNAFGFVGLCFVSHKGMQTIGFLATLGIASGLILLFTLMPYVLEKLCPREPVAEGEA